MLPAMNRSREWGSGRVAGGGGVIRVLLVDDRALLRAGLRMLIEHEDDIELVGEAVDGEEAVAAARALHPDVVLLDVNMPGLDGVEATRQIAADEQLSDVGILILTSYESEEHIFEALQAGASGFLLKDTDPGELLRAIRVLADGDALLAPSVTRALISRFASHPCRSRISSEEVRWLTDRERDVTALVAAGLSNDEIAERLVISPSTAKTHVSRAMRKVRAHDRAQLVVLAYESGLVVPGRPAADGLPRLRVVG
jgi:DNA-binding NarL/FixJ family response regulator